MRKKFHIWLLSILFGKDSIAGYYTPSEKKIKKTYIFASVFPNPAVMDSALEGNSSLENT